MYTKNYCSARSDRSCRCSDYARSRCDYVRLRRFLALAERVFQAGALWCKKFSAVFRDVHVVLKAHSEFTATVDAGFVAETHVGSKRQRVAAHQVRPLVSVHADAVAHAMSEVLVIGAVA